MKLQSAQKRVSNRPAKILAPVLNTIGDIPQGAQSTNKNMKLKTPQNTTPAGALALLALILLTGGCSKQSAPPSPQERRVTGQLETFVAEKTAQAAAAARDDGLETAPAFKDFLAAADRGDWPAVSNAYQELKARSPLVSTNGKDQRLRGTAWEAVKEIWGAYNYLATPEAHFFAPLGSNIIDSIPAGSIYFGGTDPGRFLITALIKSHAKGDPFFVITQNALADNSYLDYVREMYEGKIYIPTSEDTQKCFQDYIQEAGRRLDHDTRLPNEPRQIKPGEDVRNENGRIQISGTTAVMAINGLLAKIIFDKNPSHDVYIEESFPLEWMFPYLEPHGLIMKVNRQSLPELSEATIEADRAFWTGYLAPLLWDWLKPGTPVQELCAFSEKVHLRHDLNGFAGDPGFARDLEIQKALSQLRTAIADIYLWRLGGWQDSKNQPGTEVERQRLTAEADFALRQAVALCPFSPGAVDRYTGFLVRQHRKADALLVAQTAARLDPQNYMFTRLSRTLKEP
jgi:hypothetical protein